MFQQGALVGFRCPLPEAAASDWLASDIIISIGPPGVFGKSEMECSRRIVFVALAARVFDPAGVLEYVRVRTAVGVWIVKV